MRRPPGRSPDPSHGRRNARRLLAGRWRRTRRGFAAWRCRRSCRKRRGSPFSRKRLTRTGAGLSVAFTAETPGEEPQRLISPPAAFASPDGRANPAISTSLTLDGQPLSETRLFFLIRYWLATPEGRAADPAPLGDLSALPVVPHAVAYGLQMALDGLPLASIYALLAAAYSLIYAPDRTHQFRLRRNRRGGRLRGGDRGARHARLAARPAC